MAGSGVVGSSPGNACTMPNADTRAGFAVTDTLTPSASYSAILSHPPRRGEESRTQLQPLLVA